MSKTRRKGAQRPVSAYERVVGQPIPACDACAAPIEFTTFGQGSERLLYNEAVITISGGYSAFTDDLVGEKPYSYVLCEACALRTCRLLGLVDVIREHHTSTICRCPDGAARGADGFPLPCACPACEESRRRSTPAS